MQFGLDAALASLAAYLLGSISFAIVASRALRLPDPRSYGSGNPGATNVLRSGSRLAAVLTLVGDGGKGWLAVWLAALTLPASVPAVALAVFLGHLYPLFHRFRGGKGVATAGGALLGMDLWLGGGTIATWLVIAFFLRYSSLAALVASVFAPLFAWFIKLDTASVIAVALIGVLLVWRHRENIARLFAGKETRIGEKSASPPPQDPSGA